MRAKWGRTAAKDQKGAEDSREAKLRAGQGYKLLTLVAGLSPAMHACFGKGLYAFFFAKHEREREMS
jgi:hypothetical protein